MRKLDLFLIILFVALFSDFGFAKTKFISALNETRKIDSVGLDPGKGGKFGVTIATSKTKTALFYTINKKKIKKLIIYGDPKGGTISAVLFLVNDKTGLFFDINGNEILGDPTEKMFISGETSLKLDLPKKGIKKKRKFSWVLMINLIKGDENLPELYGIKYK